MMIREFKDNQEAYKAFKTIAGFLRDNTSKKWKPFDVSYSVITRTGKEIFLEPEDKNQLDAIGIFGFLDANSLKLEDLFKQYYHDVH